MLRELNLEGLSHIAGGTVDAAFSKHVKRAIMDCEDRPGDKNARTISLVVKVTPVILQDGAITDVQIERDVASAVPKHVSKTVECRVKAGGRALFNDLSEADYDQRTIDEVTG